MKRITEHRAIWFYVAVFAAGIGPVFGQQGPEPKPLMQQIRVYVDDPIPAATPSPLVKRTGSAEPSSASAAPARAIRTSIPLLAETPIPGNSGVLVESLNGDVVVESGSDIPLNPASNVKVATTYAVLKAFGPDYRFPTNVWTDGSYEQETATIHGNLYISGRDPVFSFEDAVRIASELNRIGIRNVKGDLIVTDNFVMNYSGSVSRSSAVLFATLDGAKRSSAASRAWDNFRANSGYGTRLADVPGVTFTGAVYVQSMPSSLRLIFSHESAPMRDIIKVMMSYSNNFLSERLGEMVGGPHGVSRTVQQDTGAAPAEFYLQTASGLGINRVSASAMMKLLKALRSQLDGWRMSLADVMPVAGLDRGTLEGRFASDYSRGSVIGKTGTLGSTDSGVSSLAGELNTKQGRFLFVIFNQRGSVSRFRYFQDNYVSIIQGQFGGAMPVSYAAPPLDARLAKTRISYPDGRPRVSD